MKAAIALLTLLLPFAASADVYAAGDSVEAFELADQHDVARRVDLSLRLILFSRDMDGGDLLKAALKDAPEGHLDAIQAVYVADISGMPSLVARLFALPSMRRRPYPMLLDRDGSKTTRLPDVEGKATLIFLKQLQVTRVLHLSTSTHVREVLGLPDPAEEPE